MKLYETVETKSGCTLWVNFLTIIQIKVLLYHKLINFCLITMKKL